MYNSDTKLLCLSYCLFNCFCSLRTLEVNADRNGQDKRSMSPLSGQQYVVLLALSGNPILPNQCIRCQKLKEADGRSPCRHTRSKYHVQYSGQCQYGTPDTFPHFCHFIWKKLSDYNLNSIENAARIKAFHIPVVYLQILVNFLETN